VTAIELETRAFTELDGATVYALLALRARVFVVEQHCAYQDPDGLDLEAIHVLARERGALIACARILAPGAGRYPDAPAIGRVVVAPEARGRDLGRALMRHAIAACERAHGPVPIALSAQAHLERLYASLGFVRASDLYDDDGIPHIDMRRPARG
jgi:ElaA protein